MLRACLDEMPSMIGYQVVAKGPFAMFAGNGYRYSNRVFVDRRKALLYLHDYTRECTQPAYEGDQFYLKSVSEMSLREVEIVE